MIFDCKMCGQCCEGRGGIVLSERDIARLQAFLGLEKDVFLQNYTESVNKKTRILVGADGFCVFFRKGQGCSAHPAKPDVCRAWPFFRGNLEDKSSFQMAREYCPGIERACEHAAFVVEGVEYLQAAGLIYSEDKNAPEALKIPAGLLSGFKE